MVAETEELRQTAADAAVSNVELFDCGSKPIPRTDGNVVRVVVPVPQFAPVPRVSPIVVAVSDETTIEQIMGVNAPDAAMICALAVPEKLIRAHEVQT